MYHRLRVVPIFPQRQWGSPPRQAFLAWGDFNAGSRFARSTIPEEKWGLRQMCVRCQTTKGRKTCTSRLTLGNEVQTK